MADLTRRTVRSHSSDAILIEGMRVRPRIGTTAAERRTRPRCRVDLKLECDLTASARSDRLEDTVDYEAVYQEVKRIAGDREYVLLESLASAVAQSALKHPGVRCASVTVRKLGKPGVEAFGVALSRRS